MNLIIAKRLRISVSTCLCMCNELQASGSRSTRYKWLCSAADILDVFFSNPALCTARTYGIHCSYRVARKYSEMVSELLQMGSRLKQQFPGNSAAG